MSNLDAPASYETIDPLRIRDDIRQSPEWCHVAYAAGRSLALPDALRRARRVVFAGMGHAAIAGDMVRALYARESPLHLSVWRDYDLPAFASGPDTLVIASSATGADDEPLSALEEAGRRQCGALVICPGGDMALRASQIGAPCYWPALTTPAHQTGLWQIFLLLGILSELWLIPDPGEAVTEAVSVMREAARVIGPDSPAVRNPSKRLAGQFVGRLPIIVGAGILASVAAYWKLQLNHIAKTAAVCDEMPNANHGSILGYGRPDPVWQKSIVIALRGACDDRRVAARHDLTTTIMLEAGLNQDTARARGVSPLAQACSLAYFGDWTAYYTAIMADIDPASAPLVHHP
ncbi:MAG: SIS domain-containing protein [Anaerolineae bacterium]